VRGKKYCSVIFGFGERICFLLLGTTNVFF